MRITRQGSWPPLTLRKYTAEEVRAEYKTTPDAAKAVSDYHLRSEKAAYTVPRAARA